jgi:type II secretory pathway pseudopilin PulG
VKNRGITLIELLISIILSGIVVFIVIQMLTGEHGNYTKTRRVIKLQSDGQDALRILEEEFKNAGYNRSDVITSGVLSGGTCPNTTFTNGAHILSDKITGKEAIALRFSNPMNGTVDCNRMTQVEYRWNATTKQLSRRVHPDELVTNLPTTIDWTQTDFVPLLDSVLDFSILYGRVQDSVKLLQSTQVPLETNLSATNWSLSTNLTGKSEDGVLNSNTMRMLTFNFPDVAGTSTARLKLALPVTTGLAASEANLNDTSSYVLDFYVQTDAGESFIASGTGLNGRVALGLATSAGTWFGKADSLTQVNFRPTKSTRHIEYVFSPVLDAGQSTQAMHLQLSATMAGAGTGRSLTLYGLQLTRLQRGRVFDWSAGNVIGTNMNQVKALRFQMQTSKKKDTASYDRIIQVVNNGN